MSKEPNGIYIENSAFGWILLIKLRIVNISDGVIPNLEEITPETWANSLIQFMANPGIFEFISQPYNRMVASEPKLKLGKGMLAKFVDEECNEYLEWVKRKGKLLVRRRIL